MRINIKGIKDKRKMKAHKFAEIFPLMDKKEFEALKEDINKKGLQEAIVIFEDKILEGRNRYNACNELKIKPKYEQYTGNDAFGYVTSVNKRRQLTDSQRAISGVRWKRIYSKMYPHGGDRKSKEFQADTSVSLKDENKQVRDLAGDEVGCSGSYIQLAEEVIKKMPEAEKMVMNKEINLKTIHRELKLKEQKTEIKKLKGVKEIMQRSSHPLSAFSQDCLEKGDGEKISKQDMFEVYSAWCVDKEIARMTKDQLGKQLMRFVPYIMTAHDSKIRYWLNVIFTNVERYQTKKKIKNDGQKKLSQSQREMTACTPFSNPIKDNREVHNKDNIVDNNDNNNNVVYDVQKGVAAVTKDVDLSKIRLEFVNREDKNLTFDEFCKQRENIDILDKKDEGVINNE